MAGYLAEIRALLINSADLDPELVGRPSVDGLIDSRIRQLGLAGPAAYVNRLQREPAEVEWLVEGIAVPETWLFRYPESFRLLARSLVSLRMSRPPTARLRMLSAGCATGEEAYSMAIAAAEAGWAQGRLAIDAIDRSRRATEAARGESFPSGRYVTMPPRGAPVAAGDRGRGSGRPRTGRRGPVPAWGHPTSHTADWFGRPTT